MTIRSRLTLWYSAILFVSVLIITGLSYREFVHERTVFLESKGRDAENDSWEDIAQIGLSCGVPATVVGLVGGWWLMRKAMQPVKALTDAASRINDQNFREQLPRTGNGDELDRLTEVFNAMTARLDASFNRIREFTLHASHELKTPLTVMHGEIETALRDNSLNNRERLLSQLDEIQRLTRIVDGLSLLTKADAGLITLKSEPLRLDELVREGFADAQILARPYHINTRLARCQEISIAGDRHRLRQLLLNLTDNAVKYNQPQGDVTIDLHRNEKFAELRISNTGPGIPTGSLSRVFDRFFRGESALANNLDGCGLGLSIAQWIVQAHRGAIEITSDSARLTTVTVRLPLAAS